VDRHDSRQAFVHRIPPPWPQRQMPRWIAFVIDATAAHRQRTKGRHAHTTIVWNSPNSKRLRKRLLLPILHRDLVEDEAFEVQLGVVFDRRDLRWPHE
jgi:hypothetical protein